MNRQENHFYEFGNFRLDPAEHSLYRNGSMVPLRPKVFEILLFLVENSGHLVQKEELLEKVWPGQFVEEGNLNKNISILRHALGESPRSYRYIETVPRLGYRFIARVDCVPKPEHDLIVEKQVRTRVLLKEEEEIDDSAISVVDERSVTPLRTVDLVDLLQRHSRSFILALAGGLILVAAVFGFRQFAVNNTPRSEQRLLAPLPQLKMTRLSFTGRVGAVAISPDGRYVAYVASDTGGQTIWLRQVATDSAQQISSLDNGFCHSLTFSRDGAYLYYTRSDEADSTRSLYRIPALGGVSTKVVADVFESVSVSPDDQKIAFARKSLDAGECSLMLATSNGMNERRLAVRKLPDHYSSPAWSPDGKLVAAVTGNGDKGGMDRNVVVVDVADGRERTITDHSWRWIRDISWVADGTGLIMTAEGQPTNHSQIWFLSYPGGSAQIITNDLNRYVGVSLTSDSRVLATTLTDSKWNVWIAPTRDAGSANTNPSVVDTGRARQIAAGSSGVTWTPDGRVVFSSFASGNQELWRANADGSELHQLTSGPGLKRTPVVSSDGRYVVFACDVDGALHLWRMGINGEDLKQLTSGAGGENYPYFSPDAKTVFYVQVKDWTLWHVSIDGGYPEKIADSYSNAPSVSPEGKLIAYYHRDKSSNSKWNIAVGSISALSTPKLFDVPRSDSQSTSIRWTADGRAVTYEAVNDGVSNIWRQPIVGGPPQQLTDFKSDYISYFAWSSDNRQLALIRGGWSQDLVLITGFR